ncbi:glycoside hydrolase family 3 N-terminal domain-containing protein [Flavivirga abyssicola]|uniref:glycoside hydrolase family 3 N-terminal domain-containing protein n=1 Tax=Flavivirga abyssicola TaxID=3063533 RepID=UPI0026E0398C|nr:glycoside hydrolase family 3 N-terminal domain-containing protein [Flavivirga sp. MEBiC07777]WVK13159.1 glycoside hydrolase family 3 N-terminal domain-containing protein [Flavivirga sp. MEBiC07777]
MKYYLVIIALTLIGCSENKVSTTKNNVEEKFIDSVLATMSIDDKIGQTNLRGTSSRSKTLSDELKEDVRQGKVGALLNVMNVEFVDELQKIAVEESPNKIPLIFGRDVVHGFKTIFPIPIGLASSWDTNIVKSSSRIAAIEASSVGIRWTFAPMLDIARDSRWGRIAESPGEDPYLASIYGKAYVEGFQGDSLNNPTSIAACAKHYIGYGAVIGGRDYNTTIIPEPLLRNVYLPPFQSALDAGAATVMTSFNEINGIPATGNEFLLKNVLRDELNFDGFVVSDWDSVIEMIAHGYAKDEKQAGELAANAGMDMEMTSRAYEYHLKDLIKEGKVTESQLNAFVKNILRIKLRLGLFETPYRDKNNEASFYKKGHLEEAKEAAIKSSVLLKNKNILPLSGDTKVALIGPLANAPLDQMGTWTFDGEKEHTITPLKAFKDAKVNVTYVTALTHSRDRSKAQFKKAINGVKDSDVIVFVAGEEAILSGEAHSRASLDLPGVQEDLIKELSKTGKPIVLVIMAGRPITITNIIDNVDAVLMSWHPGTMGGAALQEIIFGFREPEGRLPVSWPKVAGQLPYFYNHKNTGRPANKKDYVAMYDIPIGAWQSSLGNDSHYLDIGYTPHFPFGFGLGYTEFQYDNLQISKDTIGFNEELLVKVSITNVGEKKGKEIVQFYTQDIVGSITRPVRELKGFEHVSLNAGETKEVIFKVSAAQLEFTNHKQIRDAEEGDFNIWVGADAESGLKHTFYLKK